MPPIEMRDPTYEKNAIDADPEWALAFTLSEILNDDAPIGWSRYILVAKCLLALYVVLPREPSEKMTNSPDYVAGNWSRRNWEAILRSAGLSKE